MQAKPNFILAGAPKSGTSALYAALATHPQVLASPMKEPDFFLADDAPRKIATWDEYLDLFSRATSRTVAIGEGSVNYLASPHAARKIKNSLGGDVRLLFLLRDPVTAAHSMWRHNVRTADESRSFMNALEDEIAERHFADAARVRTLPAEYYNYLSRLRYGRQLSRFAQEFEADRLWIAYYEEFFAAPQDPYAALCRFLKIEDSHRPQWRIVNQGGTHRSQWVRDAIHQPAGWKGPMKRLLPPVVRDRIRGLAENLNRSRQSVSPVPEAAVRLIREHLEADVEMLARLAPPPWSR